MLIINWEKLKSEGAFGKRGGSQVLKTEGGYLLLKKLESEEFAHFVIPKSIIMEYVKYFDRKYTQDKADPKEIGKLKTEDLKNTIMNDNDVCNKFWDKQTYSQHAASKYLSEFIFCNKLYLNCHQYEYSLLKESKVISGPPGTGKSHKLNQQLKELNIIQAEQSLRVIGHPELTNAQFIGTYRPNMKADTLTYSFSPGPFTKLLYRALRYPSQPHVLIIEELNRTNAAAMFAEAFQLLDRDADGWSEYATDLGDDVREYLCGDDPQLQELLQAGVKLPPNFAIWATMNTADQGVFPMDTAFKRRWSFEYLGVNEGKETWDKEPWNPKIYEQPKPLMWQELRHYINTLLEAQGVDEDRQLGGFFLSEAELSDKDNLLEHIINKVIGYLRDDVMRYEPEKLFKAVEGGTRAPSFSQLRTTLLKAKNGDDFLKIFVEADGKEHTVDRVRELYTSIDTHQLNEAEATQPTTQDEEPTSESATSEQPEG